MQLPTGGGLAGAEAEVALEALRPHPFANRRLWRALLPLLPAARALRGARHGRGTLMRQGDMGYWSRPYDSGRGLYWDARIGGSQCETHDEKLDVQSPPPPPPKVQMAMTRHHVISVSVQMFSIHYQHYN